MWFYFNIFFALLTGDWKIFQQSNLEKKETLWENILIMILKPAHLRIPIF